MGSTTWYLLHEVIDIISWLSPWRRSFVRILGVWNSFWVPFFKSGTAIMKWWTAASMQTEPWNWQFTLHYCLTLFFILCIAQQLFQCLRRLIFWVFLLSVPWPDNIYNCSDIIWISKSTLSRGNPEKSTPNYGKVKIEQSPSLFYDSLKQQCYNQGHKQPTIQHPDNTISLRFFSLLLIEESWSRNDKMPMSHIFLAINHWPI